MRNVRRIARPVAFLATAGLMLSVLAAPGSATPAPTAGTTRSGRPGFAAALTGPGHTVHYGSHGEVDVNVCSDAVAPGYAHCDARVRTDLAGERVQPHQRVSGAGRASPHVGSDGAYDPSYLQSAYNAPSATNGVGQTVAIVDAFDAPNVESDLAVYRSEYGLPACTTANGCFTKIDQNGGTNYPPGNTSWEREISLDVDMVSAMCPLCHIVLVEATNSSFFNLGTAVNTAVNLGANVVSNSYGGPEWSGEPQADVSFYNHPGVAVVASTGDSGFGVNYPAASPDVVAVGGTSLFQATNTGTRNATETVWNGAGSGCSVYEPKPAWQTDSGCTHRSVGDIAAVADPNTGVWVYDGGWGVFGGTSASAPIVGALYALAGNPASTDQLASYPYAHTASLNDITSGSNGNCGNYLCTGGPGYDGPTGLGTPNGIDAFTSSSGPPPPDPDFSLTRTTVPAMRPGGTVQSDITVKSEDGFGGTVHLSVAASPASGLSNSLSASNVIVGALDGKSTLTIEGDKAGTYTVTITATQGSLTHTRTLTVNVNDFSIHVTPSKVTVARPNKAHYTVTLTKLGTFKGVVTLSISGLRSHDTVSYQHNPTLATGPQTVTITTSTLDAKGTLTLHIKGASNAGLSHTAVVTLVLT